jgi:hypothetical protein
MSLKIVHFVRAVIVVLTMTPMGIHHAHAAPQTKAEAAQAFLNVSGFDGWLKSKFDIPSFGLPFVDQIIGTLKDNPGYQQVVNRISASSPIIRKKILEAYADKFEAGELTALTKFFESPLGQKYVALHPELELIAAKLIVEEAVKSDPNISKAIDAEKTRTLQREAERAALQQKADEGDSNAMYKLAALYCLNRTTRPQGILRLCLMLAFLTLTDAMETRKVAPRCSNG